jgi:predicted enzyme related to lactoylglutathione lyase
MNMSRDQINTINYFELPSDATRQLMEFYASMFNGEFKEGKDTKDYWYIENAGIKGAVLKRRESRQTATFYVEVNSIDECISKAQKEGANIVIGKQEISEGYYALLEDPQHNVIGIWESRR